MSDRHPGMNMFERGVSAAAVHANGTSERMAQDTKKTTNKKGLEAGEQQSRAERAVQSSINDGQKPAEQRDFLLAQLDQLQEAIEDADNDTQRNDAELRKQEINAKLRALRDHQITSSYADLPPVEEYESAAIAYGDVRRRYAEVGALAHSDASPTTQRTMRNFRGRIDELLPTIAKQQLEADLAYAPKETHQRMLESRLAEIEAFDDKEGYEDFAEELIERDLIKEKLEQLRKWETVKETPTIVARKKELRSLKARVTAITNEISKKTQEMYASWNPFTRMALSKKLIDLRIRREEAQAMIQVARTASEAPSRTTEVRMNIPYEELADEHIAVIDENSEQMAAK